MGALAAATIATLRTWAGELLTAFSLIGGWLLVTYAFAAIIRPRVIWPFSIGMLLLSMCGWGLIRSIVTRGLLVLSLDEKSNA